MDARLQSETGSRPPAVWSFTQLSTVTQRFFSVFIWPDFALLP